MNLAPRHAVLVLALASAAMAAPPEGYLDGASPQIVGGWARDPDFAGPIPVHVYIDGVMHRAVLANTPRAGLPCDCAWSWVPPPLGAGRHEVVAYAIGVDAQGVPDGQNVALQNSPRPMDAGCAGLVGLARVWCEGNAPYWVQRPRDTLYLSNPAVRFGVNRSYGGTIFELYDDDWNENLILEHGGGAVQLSIWGYDPVGPPAYWSNQGCDDPTPYPDLASCEARAGAGNCILLCCSEGAHVADCPRVRACEFGAGAPWNPIQAQAPDCGWDHPGNDVSEIGVHENPPWIHIVKRDPYQFTKSDAFPGLTWEQVARLLPMGVQLDYTVRYAGDRVLNEHHQEIPALFPAHGINARYFFYEGDSPWTGAAVRTVPNPGRTVVGLRGRTMSEPVIGEAAEGWISVCDEGDRRCLTVASFAEPVREVVLNTPDGEPYLTPLGAFALTPGFALSWTVYLFPYRYDQVVAGQTIRDHVRDLSAGAGCFAFGRECDDGDACTVDDRCDGAGGCSGRRVCGEPADAGHPPDPPDPPPPGGDGGASPDPRDGAAPAPDPDDGVPPLPPGDAGDPGPRGDVRLPGPGGRDGLPNGPWGDAGEGAVERPVADEELAGGCACEVRPGGGRSWLLALLLPAIRRRRRG